MDAYSFSLALLFSTPFSASFACFTNLFSPVTQQHVASESHSRSVICAKSRSLSLDLRSERFPFFSSLHVWFECQFNAHEFHRWIHSAVAAPFMFCCDSHFIVFASVDIKMFSSSVGLGVVFHSGRFVRKTRASRMDKNSLLNVHLQVFHAVTVGHHFKPLCVVRIAS